MSKNDLYKFFESDQLHISALVISDYSAEYSHWNAERSLGDWLKENKIPGIFDVDTRLITKLLREKGSMLGKVVFDEQEPDSYDPNQEKSKKVDRKKNVELYHRWVRLKQINFFKRLKRKQG